MNIIESITLYGFAWACISIGATIIIAAGFFGAAEITEKENDDEL